jgi:hypothetical protein
MLNNQRVLKLTVIGSAYSDSWHKTGPIQHGSNSWDLIVHLLPLKAYTGSEMIFRIDGLQAADFIRKAMTKSQGSSEAPNWSSSSAHTLQRDALQSDSAFVEVRFH